MATDPNHVLPTQRQLQLFELEQRELQIPSAAFVPAICIESEAKSPAQFGSSYDWTVRDMPRSWRLEIQARDPKHASMGLKSSHRAYTIQGALLRQLHGLALGHFSILSLPTTLLKGPTSAHGCFNDRDLNSELAGETAIEKRLFNFAMKETARHFIEGIENWPIFPCPVRGSIAPDPWSENLWLNDIHTLTSSFEQWIRPLRKRNA